MGYIVRIHRAYRKFLLLFDRLKSSKLVKADVAFVCCHVAELRLIFSTSRRPHHDRLRAATIRVSLPLAVGKAMKLSHVAQYAVANETLRRKNQTECHRTLHPRGNRNHVALVTFTFEETSNAQTPITEQSKEGSLLNDPADFSAADWQPSAEAFPTPTTESTGDDASLARRRKSIMWRPKVTCEQNGNYFATLRQKVQQPSQVLQHTQKAPALPINPDNEVESGSTSNEDGDLSTPRPTATQLALGTACGTFRFPIPKMSFDSRRLDEDNLDLNLTSQLDEPQDSTSPTSDTTLIEESVAQSLRQRKCGDSLEDQMFYDGMEKFTLHKESPIIRTKQRTHRRNFSTDSAWGTDRISSLPLRERVKTNGGMLQFKTSPSKAPRPAVAPSMHRRKISLNLPIKPIKAEPEVIHQTITGSSDTESVYHTPHSHFIPFSDLTQEERELEYKHRHTFVGTASLDDLLELLEFSTTHTTTKEAVAKAFIHLSATEQLHARQCSAKPNGWELVSRITPDVSNINYVAQWQVKLGSITLRHFLDLIPFDEKEECSALRVVEAFLAASHIDGRVGVGTGSKARAFRSWMVQQESTED